MALDRPIGPGQGHPSFDRLLVLIQPLGKALQGLRGTRGGAFEPGSELRRLPLAHQLRKVLGEGDRLVHRSMLRAQLGELLRLSLGARRLTPQHQPGRPAGRQGLAHRLSDARQGLPRAALPRREALCQASTARRGRHRTVTPGVAAPLEVAKQLHRGLAARIPALEEIRFIGIEQTVPVVAAAFTPSKRGGPEIALHRAETQPDVLGNRGARPSLMV